LTAADLVPINPPVVSYRLTKKGLWEVCYFVKGKRKREYYSSESKAKTAWSKIKKSKKGSLVELQALHDDVKLDLLNAFKRAERNGYDLLEACSHYEQGGDIKPAITFAEAHKAFKAAKIAKNCRPRTLQTYKYIFEPFARTFDSFDLHEIPKTDVLEWLTSLDVDPRTFNNYLKTLITLRNWADTQGYNIGKIDPFNIEAKILDETEPCIIEVADVKDYTLKACEIKKVGLVVVLVLFCGMRVEEASRTKMADIKLGRTIPVIKVSAAASKTRNKRQIELLPNAVKWVKYAIDKGCHVPVSVDEFFLNRKRKMPKLGANALRHSFCSYHLAAFKNKNETAYLAGNSPDMIDKHYKNLVEPEDAKKFWKI
tara:strand:+ start:772 stop:1881 length:1110 start_codon:yes stop_codon:yes gene_type:complete